MNRKILKLAIPSIFANVTVPIVGMVDLAISGRLGDAASIGALAIGSMLFDLLYWNMGFLRVGTGGFTAQAYGRRDLREAMKILVQAIGTALVSSLFILVIHYVYVEGAFMLISCSPQVEEYARLYFFIRVWAAPAALSLFAFKGWFIGMQNTVIPMITDISVNVINVILSIFFAFYLDMGVGGIALGTVCAQYSGLIVAISFMATQYRKLFKYVHIRADLKLREMRKFFAVNGNLILRSTCLLLVYAGFTSYSAKYGETLLAVSTIMMKLMLLYSYVVDGFAYAGEALTGRFIGARNGVSLRKAIRLLFLWTFVVGAISTFLYALGKESLFRMLTDNESVISAAAEFIPWLFVVPMVSCVAYMLDGIYIGATAARAIRDAMLVSAASFFVTYYTFQGTIGLHALYLGYIIHLVSRSVMMTVMMKKEVLKKAY